MTYIADKIKEEYRTWKLDSKDEGSPYAIFISAPTGSGKTTFVLETFLPYLVERKKRLLYLVNRTILKKQLEEKIKKLPYNQRSFITVKLYQMIEKNFFEQKFCNCIYQDYDCVVCDEAHYFLADSNYNTNTILSYIFVRNIFGERLRIYMSATIEEIYKIVKKDNEEIIYERTDWLGFHNHIFSRYNWPKKSEIIKYEIKRNYDYVKIDLLKEIEEIKEIVEKSEEKWLIFVESKNTGKKLEGEIENSIFIQSSYKKEKESKDEVDEIVRNNKSSVRVLIATSVLDNGIDFKDIELRNIIIMADVETEFVQMLGRKREDGKLCKLYLLKQKEDHFRRRYEENRKKLEIAEKSYRYAEEEKRLLIKNSAGLVSLDELKKCEMKSMLYIHNYLLSDLMNSSEKYESVRTSFLANNGMLVLNVLAFKNLENLNQYYWRMIEEFKVYGENAFLREQLRWLGKSDQEIENLVEELNLPLIERIKRDVIKKLEESAEMEMTKDEAIIFKIGISDDLKILINNANVDKDERKKYLASSGKTDRPISKQFMEFLNSFCGIPFIIIENNGKYTIRNVEEKS